MRTPCIVITRDRVSYTRLCVASLERFSDQIEIHIVDHGSTWPSMLSYLNGSPHPVHRRSDMPPRSLWAFPEGLRAIVGSQRYLVTDPDVVFDDACPSDWLCRLSDELRPEVVKVGMGLHVDDLPEGQLADRVRDWEGAFWLNRAESGRAWHAPVDTTLALYPSLDVTPDFSVGPALRLDAPYLLRQAFTPVTSRCLTAVHHHTALGFDNAASHEDWLATDQWFRQKWGIGA